MRRKPKIDNKVAHVTYNSRNSFGCQL